MFWDDRGDQVDNVDRDSVIDLPTTSPPRGNMLLLLLLSSRIKIDIY